jgi:DtxR family Mn-dependent transcriptional regulator
MPDPAFALLVFGIAVTAAIASLWPRIGLAPRLRRLLRLSERVLLEDAVKHIYTCERTNRVCSLESLAGRLEVSRARAAALLSRLTAMALVQTGGTGPTLTAEGRRSALRLVRTHRMWERYLADRTGVPASEWHDEAERMEHALSAAEVDALDTQLGHPRWDPHGDPIPTPAGDVPPDQGIGLVSAESGRTVEILHLEDEPREIYDTLIRDGLVLGGRLDIVARTDSSVRVRGGGREWDIDAVAAGNVTVHYLPPGERAETSRTTLLDAASGETVSVTGISRACQGTQRRRLLDLGVVRGTPITPEMTSAAGDPTAYRIRGALIALRRTQAAWIHVERPVDRQNAAATHGIEEVA